MAVEIIIGDLYECNHGISVTLPGGTASWCAECGGMLVSNVRYAESMVRDLLAAGVACKLLKGSVMKNGGKMEELYVVLSARDSKDASRHLA